MSRPFQPREKPIEDLVRGFTRYCEGVEYPSDEVHRLADDLSDELTTIADDWQDYPEEGNDAQNDDSEQARRVRASNPAAPLWHPQEMPLRCQVLDNGWLSRPLCP